MIGQGRVELWLGILWTAVICLGLVLFSVALMLPWAVIEKHLF